MVNNFVTIYDAQAHAQCNEMGISPFLNSSAVSAVHCVTRMLQLGWISTASCMLKINCCMIA